MNDFETELQHSRKELQDLAEDLDSMGLTESTDWDQLVLAKHSLGREIRVTRLDLAAEFLGIFAERKQLLERIRVQRKTDRYYLERDQKVEDLARRIVNDDTFVKALVPRLLEDATNRQHDQIEQIKDISPSEGAAGDDIDTLADRILQETVEVERQRLLSELISAPGAELPDTMDDFNQGFRDAIKSAMTEFSRDEFNAFSRWLRSYRRTTLNYTWLSSSEDSATPIHHLTTLMRHHESYPYGWLLQLSNNPEYAELGDEVYGIWEELAGLFGQIDFDDIIEDLKDGFPPFGPGEEDRINIVPGDGKVACKPVLLAFAKGSGSRGKFAFDNVMKAVKQHLIDCHDVLKLVVIVTDTWDSRKFMEEHFGEFSSWRRRGIRFLFLGIGAPRDQIAPIAVDLT